MPTKPLHPDVVRRNADKVAEQMGRADQERFERMLGLPVAGDRRFSLAVVLGALFEGMAREAALTAFRQFRQRLKAAADEAGVQLALEADGQTRAAPENRWCWFEGEDGRVAAAAGFTRAEVEAGARLRVPQAAVEFTERDADGKLFVPYFLSYSQKNKTLVDDLHDKLKTRFKRSKEYRFQAWQDTDIELGEDWHERIQTAIARCKIGLLMLSPEFLASDFIIEHELPKFVAKDADCPDALKPALPVALKAIDFSGNTDLKGLEKIQVFRHNKEPYLQQNNDEAIKEEFADALYQAILKALKVHLPPSPPPEPSPRRHDKQMREQLGSLPEALVLPQGTCIHLEKFDPDSKAHDQKPERIDALEYLENWLSNPNAQPYCALLGEYGMGKTTTCKALAAHLLDLREQDPAWPLPIFIDLRLVGNLAKEQPALEKIIEVALARSWLGDASLKGSRLTAEETIRLVREEGALAIFDGLDEVLVHLSDAGGRRFARELFRILPPAAARKADDRKRPGRLLLSCRSHYFRTLRDEKTFLTAEGRDGIAADDYRALVLLPFTEKQIREYLQHTLPGDDPARVLSLIRSVHNLSEIAKRPYTLSLITQHIPKIERWKLEGRRVSGVMLYREMVLEWLERDAGKHHLTPEHKCELMEHFAAELWRTGDKSWSVGQLEQWLIDYLRKRPEIDAHYTTKDRELLKEDLRTATFLVREGEDRFRFAHTSLQEYFLACHLQRALLDDQPDAWALPALNRETLDFLGQLLMEAGLAQAQIGLRNLRDTYRPRASENALDYALLAIEKDYPSVPLTGVRLEGANLRGVELLGDPDKPKLNLRGAVLRGARLDNSRFHWLDLDNADFEGADLSHTEWQQVRAEAVRLPGAKLTGAVFRNCSLESADTRDAQCYRTQWLHCRLQGVRGLEAAWPAVIGALNEPAMRFETAQPLSAFACAFTGHTGSINACAFAPDGRRLVSGSDDGTLRLWDADSGECLRVLAGHQDWVMACAFTPNGRRIVSGSHDGTLRLWDADSGECLRVLEGHEDSVNACAFAPDGRHLVSGSDDGRLRLWDADSGACLLVLSAPEADSDPLGLSRSVKACAFAPDGRRIVSASRDSMLRLWDADSGECLVVLSAPEADSDLLGLSFSVKACAFAPDGRRIVSASRDSMLRLWNADSGECLRGLEGHQDSVSACAFAPDGRRIVSASRDRTLRLWDADSGECLRVLEGHQDSVRACAFAPNGRRIVSGSHDGTLRLWDADSGECLRVLEGHQDSVRACAFAPDGRRIVSGGRDGKLRRWDADSGKCLRVLTGHQGTVKTCTFAHGGRRLVSGSDDRTLRLWDANSGECLRVLEGHRDSVSTCAFALDGRRIVSGSDDRTLRLWDADSGACLRVLAGHQGWVRACAFAPDGRRIVSGSDDRTLRMWDADSGECLRVLEGHQGWVRACAFAPDGRRIVSGSQNGRLRLWDADSGECLRVLEGHQDSVSACAFAPDGRRIVSGSNDGTLRLWDADSGECLRVFEGHQGTVKACAFAPDGRRIVSGSFDGTLRFWNSETSEPIGPVIHHFYDGFAVLDSAAKRIVQTGGDGWRYVGWQAPDPITGQLTRYPAEIFGPLPEFVPPKVGRQAL